jgi:hypothetical protein
MTPRQRKILDHLAAVPGRMAYCVGNSPNYSHVGRWTASQPQPRVWFACADIAELQRLGKLVPWRGHADALILPAS